MSIEEQRRRADRIFDDLKYSTRLSARLIDQLLVYCVGSFSISLALLGLLGDSIQYTLQKELLFISHFELIKLLYWVWTLFLIGAGMLAWVKYLMSKRVEYTAQRDRLFNLVAYELSYTESDYFDASSVYESNREIEKYTTMLARVTRLYDFSVNTAGALVLLATIFLLWFGIELMQGVVWS